jgi:hypothetical protein
VVYDIKPEDDNRVFINVAEKAMDVAAETAIPGQFLVDVFPLRQYLVYVWNQAHFFPSTQ